MTQSKRNDRPKETVLEMYPQAKAVKLANGYAIRNGRKTIGKGNSAWSAWNAVEQIGIHTPEVNLDQGNVYTPPLDQPVAQSQPKMTDTQADELLKQVNAQFEEKELPKTVQEPAYELDEMNEPEKHVTIPWVPILIVVFMAIVIWWLVQ